MKKIYTLLFLGIMSSLSAMDRPNGSVSPLPDIPLSNQPLLTVEEMMAQWESPTKKRPATEKIEQPLDANIRKRLRFEPVQDEQPAVTNAPATPVARTYPAVQLIHFLHVPRATVPTILPVHPNAPLTKEKNEAVLQTPALDAYKKLSGTKQPPAPFAREIIIASSKEPFITSQEATLARKNEKKYVLEPDTSPCCMCNQEFYDMKSLNMHGRERHADLRVPGTTKNGFLWWKCPHCKEKIQRFPQLMGHMQQCVPFQATKTKKS